MADNILGLRPLFCIHLCVGKMAWPIPGAHEPRRRRGRSVQLLYKTLCQPLSNELHKMPIYGQTLSKQGGGTKCDAQTFTMHKHLPTNYAQCMWSIVLV